MRDYGVIFTKFWTEPDVQAMSEGAQMLFLYILTGPHTTAAGCFRLPLAYVAADRNWTIAQVAERFEELSRNGFAYRCPKTDWVVIPKFLKHNPIANPNCGVAVSKCLDSLPDCFTHLDKLINMLSQFTNRLPNGFLNGLANRLPNGMPNQDQEQDQEQEQEKSLSTHTHSSLTPARADVGRTPEEGGGEGEDQKPAKESKRPAHPIQCTEDFPLELQQIFDAYPEPRQDRTEAMHAHRKSIADGDWPGLSVILADLLVRTQTPDWSRENYRFVPKLSKYIRGRMWLDPMPSSARASPEDDPISDIAARIRSEQKQEATSP
jgi:hypothetical protein